MNSIIRLRNEWHFVKLWIKAKFKNPGALFLLSSYYLFGIFVKEDHQKAYACLKQASALGLKEADKTLDYEFDSADGKITLSKQFSEAFVLVRKIRRIAEDGDVRAMFHWAVTKIESEDTSQLQYQNALRYIKIAAEYNHPNALYVLAGQYIYGKRIPTNLKKAYALILKAADLGNLGAIRTLIDLHAQEGHWQQALPYIEKAAALDDLKSIIRLSDFYLDGQFVEQDVSKGLKWQTKAAEMGDKDAQFNLALIYHKGHYGIPRDIKKAIYWYEKAVAQNVLDAITNLGAIFMNSQDKSEQERAFHLLNRACEAGDIYAAFNIGNCYKLGIGVEKDSQKALECYKQAFKKGVKEAAYSLYLFYTDGIAVPPDLQKAAYWKQQDLKQTIRSN